MIITLTIPGDPIPKARPRFSRRGSFVVTYDPQDKLKKEFRQQCVAQITSDIPMGLPVMLRCEFFMPIPKSWTKKKRALLSDTGISHVSKPDCSNMLKWVEDCLNGIAWNDDSQITTIGCEKEYSDNPRTEITVNYYDIDIPF